MRRLLVPLLVLVALLAGITLGGHPETLPGFLRDTLQLTGNIAPNRVMYQGVITGLYRVAPRTR